MRSLVPLAAVVTAVALAGCSPAPQEGAPPATVTVIQPPAATTQVSASETPTVTKTRQPTDAATAEVQEPAPDTVIGEDIPDPDADLYSTDEPTPEESATSEDSVVADPAYDVPSESESEPSSPTPDEPSSPAPYSDPMVMLNKAISAGLVDGDDALTPDDYDHLGAGHKVLVAIVGQHDVAVSFHTFETVAGQRSWLDVSSDEWIIKGDRWLLTMGDPRTAKELAGVFGGQTIRK